MTKSNNLKQILLKIQQLNQKQLNLEFKYNKNRYQNLKNSQSSSFKTSPNNKTNSQNMTKTRFTHQTTQIHSETKVTQQKQNYNHLHSDTWYQFKKQNNRKQSHQLEKNLKNRNQCKKIRNQPYQSIVEIQKYFDQHKKFIQSSNSMKYSKYQKKNVAISIQQYPNYMPYSNVKSGEIDNNAYAFITQAQGQQSKIKFRIYQNVQHLQYLNNFMTENMSQQGIQIFDVRLNLFISFQEMEWNKFNDIGKFQITIINSSNLQYINLQKCYCKNGNFYYDKNIKINLQDCFNQLNHTLTRTDFYHLILHKNQKIIYEEFIYVNILHAYYQKENRRNLVQYLMKRFLLFDKTRTRQNILLNSEFLIKNITELSQELYSAWINFMNLFINKFIYVSDKTCKIMKFKMILLIDDQLWQIRKQKRMLNKELQQYDILYNPQNPFISGDYFYVG